MASGFYNKPPVIVPNDGPEGTGKPGTPASGAPPSGASTTAGLTGTQTPTPVTTTSFSTLSGIDKGGKPGGNTTSGGGAPQTLSVPRGFQNNPMAARAATFAANASPTMAGNCATLGTLIATDPSKAGPVCDALLAARIVNGEVVIPPINIGEPPPSTDAGPASTASADTAALPDPATASNGNSTALPTGPANPVGGNSTPLPPGPANPVGGNSTPLPTGPAQLVGGNSTPLPPGPAQSSAGYSTPGSGGSAYGINVVSTDSDDQAIQNMGVCPPGGDIAEMCYVVLMNATNDQDKDLELIMATVKAQTNAKQALRTLISNVGRDVAANASQQINDPNGVALPDGPTPKTTYPGTGGPGFYTGNCPMPVPNPATQGGYDSVNTVLYTATASEPHGMTYNDLKNVQSQLQGNLDSMNEMSEMTSMNLQMAMDRRSKFVEALSNVMKKIDSTQETIVQNMKG